MLCMACTQHREYTEKLTWSDPFSVPSELRNRRGGGVRGDSANQMYVLVSSEMLHVQNMHRLAT
jgi:hypothetical protein